MGILKNPFDGALAAFETVKEAYPRNEITLRKACRVLRKREREDSPAHVDANPDGDRADG